MENKITGNEPSQPSSCCCDENGIYNGADTKGGGYGLTIRQHFAAMALQGMLANSLSNDQGIKPYSQMTYAELSENALNAADALIATLNK